ncbi:MAG: hypothetical protein U0790_17035 [Isosphaeraceae bacterium]
MNPRVRSPFKGLSDVLVLAALAAAILAACASPAWLPRLVAGLGLAGRAVRDDSVARVPVPERELPAIPIEQLDR